MSDYVLSCSSTSDLPKSFTDAHDIAVMPFVFYMDGQEYPDDQEQTMTKAEFFKRMRDGQSASTSMTNTEKYKDHFRPFLEKGRDILHIELSGGLSGNMFNAQRAADELLKEYPLRTIRLVDSLSASLGIGLLVHLTALEKEKGATLQEAAAFAEHTKLKIAHWFAVESLEYLRRGGRVSRASAFLGTMLNVKPVLAFNNEGKVIPVEKIRGRKRSLQELVTKMEQDIIDEGDGQIVYVGSADSPADAEYAAGLIRERFPKVKEIIVGEIGPTIGTHAGPGTVNIHYLAKERIDTKFQ